MALKTTFGICSAALLGIALSLGDAALAQTSQLSNISTRAQVLGGDSVMIAGFVIRSAPQTIVIRARGPSLIPFGITNALLDPVLSVVRSGDQAVLGDNDDWGASADAAAISATGFAPANSLEAALLLTLAPGSYTAVISGFGGGTGVAIVEVFAVGGTTTPPPGGGASPAGVYAGTSNAGNTVLGLVTSAGQYFFLHTPPAFPWAVMGVDMAPSAAATDSTLASNTEKSVSPLEYLNGSNSIVFASSTVKVGSFDAVYTAGANLSATFSYLPSGTLSISTTFVPGSNLPASLSVFPSTFGGRISYSNIAGVSSRFDWAPTANVTVSGTGAISGEVACHQFPVTPPPGPPPSCAITGALTPRADMNAYDVTASFVEISGARVAPQMSGKTFTGIAFFNAANNRLTFVATNPDNNLFVFSN